MQKYADDQYGYLSCPSQSLEGGVQKVAGEEINVRDTLVECSFSPGGFQVSRGLLLPSGTAEVSYGVAVWASAGAGLRT